MGGMASQKRCDAAGLITLTVLNYRMIVPIIAQLAWGRCERGGWTRMATKKGMSQRQEGHRLVLRN